MGGRLLADLTGVCPLWVGSNQPRKIVDVVGMRKKVEMVKPGCKSKLEGGVKIKLASSPMPSWGPPQTPRSPTGA